MADQVMKVDGDFKGYVNAAKTAEAATKKVAKEAGDLAKAATKAEQRTLKMAEGFSKALIPAVGLAGALQQAVSFMNKLRDRDMGASERSGTREAGLVNTANKLGLSNVFGLRKEVSNRTGGATLDGLTSFMSSLGDYNEGAKVPLSGADSESLISEYNKRGDSIFGENGRNVIKRLSEGHSAQSIISAAKGAKVIATAESVQGVFLKNKEDAALLAEENLASRPVGAENLSDGARARLFNAENRADSVGQSTMDRLGTEYFPDVYQQKVGEVGGSWKAAYDSDQQWDALKAITDATRQKNSRPNNAAEVK